MAWRLQILLFVFALATDVSAADDDSGLCKAVACGKGSCNVTSSGGLIDIKTPRCVCQTGWMKPFSLDFLPCVVPNCTIDATCSKQTPSSAPAPSISNSTGLLNPCTLALCGGGTCEKTSSFGYKCICQAGYENLLNMTAAPCVKECSIGADCSNLGFKVGGNANASSPPSQAETSGSNNKGIGRFSPCQIAMAVLSVLVLFLLR